jgi:hypothetical protein
MFSTQALLTGVGVAVGTLVGVNVGVFVGTGIGVEAVAATKTPRPSTNVETPRRIFLSTINL